MKANYDNKSIVTLGNLYEINQNLMNQEPAISPEAKEKAKNEICDFFSQYFNQRYFMFLCKEQGDYTIFNFLFPLEECANRIIEATNDLIECIENRGQWLAASTEKDEGDIIRAIEIWIRIGGEPHAYYLFPYGGAVLEY